MRFEFLLILVLSLWPPLPTRAIIKGNKYPIQKVPWIVYGEGLNVKRRVQFGGSIIHEKLVLTLGFIARKYTQMRVSAGLASLKSETDGQTRDVSRTKYNDWVGILEVSTPFLFNANVQRGSLAVKRFRISDWQVFVAAGWGSVASSNQTATELHAIAVYPGYAGLTFKERETRFLMTSFGGKNMSLGTTDIGGPVWEPRTGEIVGVIWKREDLMGRKTHSAAVVGYNRQWIFDTSDKMLANRD